MAFVLALALAFMAFDPNALRSAFAMEEEAASADAHGDRTAASQATEEGEALDEQDPGDDAAADVPAAPDEGQADVRGALPEAAPDTKAETVESHDARAGPDYGDATIAGKAQEPSDSGPVSEEPDEDVVAASSEESPASSETESAQDGRSTEFASCTVTFYSNVASANPAILARKLVSAPIGKRVTVDVSDVHANPPTSAQVFDGWQFGGEVFTASITVDPRDGNVTLYPAYSSGHWLRFVEGDHDSEAAAVPSRFVGAQDGPATTLPTTTREGYVFEGWHTGSMVDGRISYDERITDENGSVYEPDRLRAMLASADVVLYGKWIGAQTTYRLIIWHQNPEGDEYSYHSAITIGQDDGVSVISGEMTDVTQAPEFEGYTLGRIDNEVIEGDGSTVVNAEYDRNEYSIYFHTSRDEGSAIFKDLTITARHGADVRKMWPKPRPGDVFTSSWYTKPSGSDDYTFVNGINAMPLGDVHYYLKPAGRYHFNTVFLTQDVDDLHRYSTFTEQPFSNGSIMNTTADDYMPIEGFMVNAASDEDAAQIRDIPSGDDGATHDPDYQMSPQIGKNYSEFELVPDGEVSRYTSYFYYLRCQYDLVFEENGGPALDDARGVYYEQSLADLAPTDYVEGQTSYTAHDGERFVFAGWYGNVNLAGERFDFESATMPANNLVLYAKWNPAKHLVQVDPAGGEFTNESQSTYFWVEHGEKVPYIGAERHFVLDESGTHVYAYEAYPGDGDGHGDASYVIAQPGDTGQRFSYSENAYALFGWFESDNATRAGRPFDFSHGITEDTSIVARWRSAGMFDIAYDPTMDIEGGTVSGDIDVVLDPGYADLSPTLVMNTPTNIEATTGDAYAFKGWRVVEHFDPGANALIDELYAEGDGFVVDSELATNNTIHLQAVYEANADDDAAVGPNATPNDPALTPDGTDEAGDSAASDTGGTQSNSASGESAASSSADAASASPAMQRASAENAPMPQTGDTAQMLAMGAAGLSLLSLGIALIARAMRRNHDKPFMQEE